MSDTLFEGDNGQIFADNIILTNKAGNGESSIVAASGSAWTAKGFKTQYAVALPNDFVFRYDSGKTISNYGLGQISTITLPASNGPGIIFNFVRLDSYAMRINPQGSNAIIYSGGQMAGGEYLELASNGAKLSIVSDSSDNWVAIHEEGTLTEESP